VKEQIENGNPSKQEMAATNNGAGTGEPDGPCGDETRGRQAPPAARAAGQAKRDRQSQKWNMDLVLDVELGVIVSFGETQMQLKDVLKLGVGSVIELDRTVQDPVTVLVNEKPIATGEVVMVDSNYGVKVLQVESTAERIRSLA